jgi:hypothetical protein
MTQLQNFEKTDTGAALFPFFDVLWTKVQSV